MPIREVLQLGHPGLRETSQPVEDPGSREVAAIIADLRDTLARWQGTTGCGRAISAPQIGVSRRILFLGLGQPTALINPTIVDRSSEEMVVWDACLSFLSIFLQARRRRWIRVNYQDTEGAWHEMYCDGDRSELLQHEIDHLDGILAVDRMVDVTTMCTRDEFERRHRVASPSAT